ncbi:Hypothetical proteinA [Nesidiocoris tenuis]|uniref:FHA domain-containing protein n=1 Tax=Nesidiocoris tenuis TaxID=355587 RepID=A0ABN7BC68_9HEMI|nr:Hypothetical proteinA [Nesidiocoris tenuis]
MLYARRSMKESKSKCRRKHREGEPYDERWERESLHDHKDRRYADDRREIDDRRMIDDRRLVEEKHRYRPHPLDPLGNRYYRYPSEERRYRQSSLDDRRRRHNSEEKRGVRENGGGRLHGEEERRREKSGEPRLNGHHHHHHHKRKHKRRHEDDVDGLAKKKKSCRRKRDKVVVAKDPVKDQDAGKTKVDRSRSPSAPSPSPSSSSMSSPSPSPGTNNASKPVTKPSTTKAAAAPSTTAASSSAPKSSRPVTNPAPSTVTSKSSWSDEEDLPARYRNNWKRKDSDDEKDKHEESKPVVVKQEGDEKKPGESAAKPDFGLSGKLVEETNMYKGVLIKYSQPPEARMPKRRWRLYPFKGDQALPTLYIHRQSAYLIGRERKVVDIPVDHPSISKQHAVLQYRLVPYTRDDGSKGQRIRPYIIDLNSANGTYVNNQRIDPSKYVELLERDVLKFAFSSREYVLLHEHSSDGAQDDEAV